MKIDEAIGDLSVQAAAHEALGQKGQAEADKLGIEALTARKREREDGYVDLDDLLSGETK